MRNTRYKKYVRKVVAQRIVKTLSTCVFVYVLYWGLTVMPIQFDFVAPIEDALSDFELTDLVFSKLSDDKPPLDTNVVLVNIGNMPRPVIAQEIRRINEGGPKCIAIDAMFFADRGEEMDSAMANAMAGVENMILVSKLLKPNEETGFFDSIGVPTPAFLKHCKPAFANLITEGEEAFRTSRIFTPWDKVGDSMAYAFSIEIARSFDSAKTAKFLSRGKKVETIKFRRNREGYRSVDVEELFSDTLDPKIFKGKMVLMGFMGADFKDKTWTDKFFTPLNQNFAGKSYPDMYGLIVHANVISMVMEENYIDETGDLLEYSIAFILLLMNLYYFHFVNDKMPNLYDLITKALQLTQIILMLYLTVMIYKYWSVKVNFTLAIALVALSGDLLELFNSTLGRLFFKKINFKNL